MLYEQPARAPEKRAYQVSTGGAKSCGETGVPNRKPTRQYMKIANDKPITKSAGSPAIKLRRVRNNEAPKRANVPVLSSRTGPDRIAGRRGRKCMAAPRSQIRK